MEYQAILWLSFGGPEGQDDVVPFLENVTRGRHIPKERLEVVAEQYYIFGGHSSINQQNREIISTFTKLLSAQGINLPIYFGNRNWEPYVADTVAQMIGNGVKSAIVFATSAYSSYSSCRQYLEDLESARDVNQSLGNIILHKVRGYYNHPLFLESLMESLVEETEKAGIENADELAVITTGHSIPISMASACDYEQQLSGVSNYLKDRFAKQVDPKVRFYHAYQSRSGSPSQPWLEPDVGDLIEEIALHGVKKIIVLPIGFISDHQEVRYDLDILAKNRALGCQVEFYRARTVSSYAPFYEMLVELVKEKIGIARPLAVFGEPLPEFCPPGCCLK